MNLALDGQDAEAVCRVEKKLHVPLKKVRKVLKIVKEPLSPIGDEDTNCTKEPRQASVTRRGSPGTKRNLRIAPVRV